MPFRALLPSGKASSLTLNKAAAFDLPRITRGVVALEERREPLKPHEIQAASSANGVEHGLLRPDFIHPPSQRRVPRGKGQGSSLGTVSHLHSVTLDLAEREEAP